jgi:uncharacterized protein
MVASEQSWSAWEECGYSADEVLQALAAGADANASYPGDGRTPLIVAASAGATDGLALLLEAGADPNASTDRGWTALMVASRAGASTTVARLVAAGADVNAIDDVGWSALVSAAVNGDLACVRSLVEAGAELDVRTDDGDSPLSVALDQEHREVADYLKEKGARPSATEQLLEALLARDVEQARGAIAAGADLSAYPFLWKVIEDGEGEMLAVLVAAGVPFDEEADDGERPIEGAARLGKTDMVRVLVEAGAKLEGKALQNLAETADWSELAKLLAADWTRRLDGA